MEKDTQFGSNPKSPAKNRLSTLDSVTDSNDVPTLELSVNKKGFAKRCLSMSPIFRPFYDSPMKTSFSSFDRLDDRCLGPGELRLVEGMQTSLTETVTVMSSRIRYLEDLVDTYRRELAEVTDIKISLRVKEIECHDLVCAAKPLHTQSEQVERLRWRPHTGSKDNVISKKTEVSQT
jgi:hypothetical protein